MCEKGHYSGLTVRLFLIIGWQFGCFKLQDPSSSSDTDSNEWGGQPPRQHFTISLVSDCPMVTVHLGKCFKALIDSVASISLMCTCVYNMIEDCYKTSILPAAINVWTEDRSPMSLRGKATLHLQIAEFKLSYTFVICDRLQETDFLFALTYRNGIPYLIVWTQTDISSYKGKALSWHTPETGKTCIIFY